MKFSGAEIVMSIVLGLAVFLAVNYFTDTWIVISILGSWVVGAILVKCLPPIGRGLGKVLGEIDDIF